MFEEDIVCLIPRLVIERRLIDKHLSCLVYFLESPESWKWKKNSIIHREKFIKLLKHGQEHPEEIKDINGVRVCCSKDFLIGRGSDATRVYIGLGKDGYERAVKRLPRDDCDCLAEQEKKVLNELNTTESNHVVKYRGFFDDKSDKDWLYLIMDLCEETLKEFVERSSLDDLATNAQTIIQQVLTGLADLHRDPKPIFHRDLKPSNILRNVNDKWLLADFGISRILTQEVSTFRSKEKGTKHWKAVESCSTNDMSDDDVRYKKKSDIQVGFCDKYQYLTRLNNS
jgi:serine/threonine protein kinase